MREKKNLIWIILILFLLAACGSQQTAPVESPVVDTAVPTQPPIDTPTPLPPVGVLLTPEGADQHLIDELNSVIGGYIRELDLRYQVLASLSESDFEREQYQVVIVLPPFPGLQSLAASAPETRFLAVGFNDIEPAANLSVLRSGGGDYDIQGFAAGYIAAMITTDWRVGALSVQENPDALAARDGFRAGVKYFCGLCNPKYAPTGVNYVYPKYIDLPADATDLQISANIDFLVDRAVNTFYIVPGVGTPQIYRMLVAYEKNIIGAGADFREEYSEYWVASMEYDQLGALQDFWPQFLEADFGIEYTPPLLLTDINDELLSEGKVLLVEKILEEVAAGFIKTSYE